MKTKLLLPRACRIAGLVMLPLFIALFIAMSKFDFVFSFLQTKPTERTRGIEGIFEGNHNLTDELAVVGIIASLFMIAFSRLKLEDEYISAIRLRSLQIGVYANYILFVLMELMVYDVYYLAALFYNVITILVLFILVFNYNLYIAPRFARTTTV